MKTATPILQATRMGLLLSLALLIGQPTSLGQSASTPPSTPKAGIAWHGTWKGGLAEAKRTGKPIMLVSAALQCHSVPGVW